MYMSSGDTDLVSPLHGIEVGFDEAQELAHRVDTLRAEGQVKLLNFAFLSLNKSQLLGVGSFSKVRMWIIACSAFASAGFRLNGFFPLI